MRLIGRFGNRVWTRPWHRRCLAAIAAAAVSMSLAGPAAARSEKTLAYPREQAWPTAVRFLVVNERVKVTDKDADAGYVMFELRDDGKTYRGSLELVTIVRDGQAVVRFVLQIADRPSWLEIAMLGRLEAKLRAELGSPSPPPAAPPKPAKPPKQEPPRDAEPPREAPPPDEPRLEDRSPPITSRP